MLSMGLLLFGFLWLLAFALVIKGLWKLIDLLFAADTWFWGLFERTKYVKYEPLPKGADVSWFVDRHDNPANKANDDLINQ